MSDLDEKLDRACADGRMSTEDADEVRTFASFLASVGPPLRPDSTPEARQRFRDAYREHYPDDYAHAVAEEKARQETRTP